MRLRDGTLRGSTVQYSTPHHSGFLQINESETMQLLFLVAPDEAGYWLHTVSASKPLAKILIY